MLPKIHGCPKCTSVWLCEGACTHETYGKLCDVCELREALMKVGILAGKETSEVIAVTILRIVTEALIAKAGKNELA